MATNKTTLRFWLRTDKPNKDGSAPVHLVYQIQGQRKYYAIPAVKIFEINWNADDQKVIYLDKKAARKKDPKFDFSKLLSQADVTELNSKLFSIKTDVDKIEDRFRDEKIQFSPQMVIDKLKEKSQPETKKDEPGINVIDYIFRFINNTKAHRDGTKKEYKSLANHLLRYETIKKVKLTFQSIDKAAMSNVYNFLLERYETLTKGGNRKVVQINNITAAKLISTLKTVITKAEDDDIPVNPKYAKFKNPHPRKDKDVKVIALSDDELEKIYTLDLSKNKALDESRDIFCFSCASGLRYGDLEALRWHHITKDNRIVIPMSDKNDKEIDVPLTPMSYAILKKYEGKLYPLPVTKKLKLISNQKLNDNIKKIGNLAGLDDEIEIMTKIGPNTFSKGIFKKYQLLSIHKGRKSFTSISLSKGIAVQDVMSMTTHSSYSSMKPYVDITSKIKKTAMVKAYGEIPKSNLKAV